MAMRSRDVSCIRLLIALMACRKAAACCADTADRRATAAWFGAVFSSGKWQFPFLLSLIERWYGRSPSLPLLTCINEIQLSGHFLKINTWFSEKCFIKMFFEWSSQCRPSMAARCGRTILAPPHPHCSKCILMTFGFKIWLQRQFCPGLEKT